MFRSLGKSKIAFVLAILFGISLFFFRGGSRYSNLFNSDNIIASVSGTPISTTKFIRVLQLNINNYNQMLGKELSKDEIKAFQLHAMSLGNLINNAVFENEFENKNFIIDDTVVAKKTKERLPNIYSKNNQLNELALNSFLKKQNLKIDDLVNIINFETRARVFDNLFFDTSYPNYFNQKISLYDNHNRKVNLITIGLDDFKLGNLKKLNMKKDNQEIIEFYKKNLDDYMSRETRDVSYILIDKKKYTEQFIPSFEEINYYYTNNKNLFTEPEKRDFIQFNFKKDNQAIKFKQNIKGLNFEEITNYAKNKNITFNNFNDVSKNEVLEELANVIFNLDKFEVSEVIETTLAKHVIVLKNVSPKIQKSLKDSANEIKKTLLNVELDNFFLEIKNNISQQILDGLSINNIASNNNLNINSLYKIKREIDKKNTDNIKNEIINNAFISNKNFVSDLIDIDEDISFILNVDNIYHSKAKKFDEIFENVSVDWLKSKKVEFVNNLYENSLKNNNPLRLISEQLNSEVDTINLEKGNSDYPREFTKLVFKTKLNSVLISNNNDKIFIAQIEKVDIPKKLINNMQTISINSLLKNAFGNEIIKTKKISTNTSLLNALITNY